MNLVKQWTILCFEWTSLTMIIFRNEEMKITSAFLQIHISTCTILSKFNHASCTLYSIQACHLIVLFPQFMQTTLKRSNVCSFFFFFSLQISCIKVKNHVCLIMYDLNLYYLRHPCNLDCEVKVSVQCSSPLLLFLIIQFANPRRGNRSHFMSCQCGNRICKYLVIFLSCTTCCGKLFVLLFWDFTSIAAEDVVLIPEGATSSQFFRL